MRRLPAPWRDRILAPTGGPVGRGVVRGSAGLDLRVVLDGPAREGQGRRDQAPSHGRERVLDARWDLREGGAGDGLALVQIGGMTLHLTRGEVREIGLNIALLALAAVAVWLGTVWL
ncbi:hypothetical protein SALBM311S_09710 [Streptomyces alboniger]